MHKTLARAGFTAARFDTGSCRIAYARGPANGPALVLIPGQGATWQNYAKVMPALSRAFEVFAVDIRGHGGSDWTTGDYSFTTIGADMTGFLKRVVGRPAILSGNSSGGLIATWLAANHPVLVHAVIAEDAPFFAADWPRIKSEFVYSVLGQTVEIMEILHASSRVAPLAQALNGIARPVRGKHAYKRMPRWMGWVIAWTVRAMQREGLAARLLSALLPARIRLFAEVLTSFDPDFSRAWVDGRIYAGLDHADALARVRCPMLMIHADWFRHPEAGLVGAMDADDAARARALVADCRFLKVDSPHVMHSAQPKAFVAVLRDFAARLPSA